LFCGGLQDHCLKPLSRWIPLLVTSCDWPCSSGCQEQGRPSVETAIRKTSLDMLAVDLQPGRLASFSRRVFSKFVQESIRNGRRAVPMEAMLQSSSMPMGRRFIPQITPPELRSPGQRRQRARPDGSEERRMESAEGLMWNTYRVIRA
jgi:hypothetical protein